MIKGWLDTYKPKNLDEATQALREIMQEIALAGLYRAGFFEKAAFYGGTALRIFYNLDRFSEDLDFSLLKPDQDFSLDKYLNAMVVEFEALGMQVSIREKTKSNNSHIDSAFLKSETLWKELVLEGVIPQYGLGQTANIKIKIEVDTVPPPDFDTEEKLLVKPFSFYVKCFILPDLFAGKMHALLFRKWKDNVKGRDWYDLEWYVRRGTALDLKHFVARTRDSGDWHENTMSEMQFREILEIKIKAVNMSRVKADISRFIPNPEALNIWSEQYFLDLVSQMKIRN